MTQEEKQLLIKDLCARVPYKSKVKVLHVWNEEKEIEEDIVDTVHCVLPEGYINTETIDSDIPLNDNVILYLRPLSSITEEEKNELRQEHVKDEKLYAECLTKAANGDNSMRGKVIPHFAADWCNKNHFDYRGLIPMGLALEAPSDMYKTEYANTI